jgi:hypothetical protein
LVLAGKAFYLIIDSNPDCNLQRPIIKFAFLKNSGSDHFVAHPKPFFSLGTPSGAAKHLSKTIHDHHIIGMLQPTLVYAKSSLTMLATAKKLIFYHINQLISIKNRKKQSKI